MALNLPKDPGSPERSQPTDMPSPPLSAANIQAGSRIGSRYDLRDRIGAGAFGTVWEAYDLRLRRLVAIKLMPLGLPDDELAQDNLQRFRIEAQAVARLSHSGIVTVHDFGEEADFAWFVMELIIGETLKAVLDRGEHPSLTEAVRVITELLAALQHAHARGIVHRDVKPANVLLSMGIEQGVGEVKLADFGIARVGDRSRTRSGQIIGTPAAMAPEQLRGEPADLRADIWAVGLLLYHLLTGRPAFGNAGFATLRSALNDTPPAPSTVRPGVPAVFDPILYRALAKEPAQRYASAAEMAEALRAALEAVVADRVSDAPSPAAAGTSDQVAETVRLSAGTALIRVQPLRLPPPHAPSRGMERLGLVGLGLILGLALAFGWGEMVRDAGRPVGSLAAPADHVPPPPNPAQEVREAAIPPAAAAIQAGASPPLPEATGEAPPTQSGLSAGPAALVDRLEGHGPPREPPAPALAANHAGPATPGPVAPAPAEPASRIEEHEALHEAPAPAMAAHHAAPGAVATAPAEPMLRIEEHEPLREPPAPAMAVHHAARGGVVSAPAEPVSRMDEHEPLREPPAPAHSAITLDASAAPSLHAPAPLPEATPPTAPTQSQEATLPRLAGAAVPAPAELPLCPADRLAVRAGSHPDYGRLVFDWQRAPRYDVAPIPGGVRLHFRDIGCAPSVARLALPRNVRALATDPVTGEIRIETAPGTRVRHFRLDGRVVLDVQDGG
jgi:hypothetical protein